ncbi:MAG: phospho-N-acetylmuramoyl-pentapeptide-transferase [Bradymonadaceae bacterium]
MLFELFFQLKDVFGPFNVFRYVSFRVMASMGTALLICLFAYPWFIRQLQGREIGEVIREDNPDAHDSKEGTPTMGGVLILFSVVTSTVLWADLENPYVGVILGITVLFASIGYIDDYHKIAGAGDEGLSGRARLGMEFAVAGAAMWVVFFSGVCDYSSVLYFPFVSTERFSLTLPIWIYLPFALITVVGTANAVNITDGLDGLAIGPVIVSVGAFLILSYITGSTLHFETVVDGSVQILEFDLAEYLMIPKVEGVQELAIFCASIIGAGVGFLWYNSFPAQIFMGDVGSLSLGGALGGLAVVTKHELLSIIIFGIFVVEAVSVIMQTISYKLTGERVFRMAPIHHHFEMKGWPEPKIIVRFWIVSIMLALVALSSLKLR